MKCLFSAVAIVCFSIGLAGCGKSPTAAVPADTEKTSAEHNHDSWWCAEHGVPEEVCAQCNAKLAADFKANGDWCKSHDCPDSQCFKCHPELEEKFAQQYEAKYGSRPPKPSSEEKKDEKIN